jgi:hypothetical protein
MRLYDLSLVASSNSTIHACSESEVHVHVLYIKCYCKEVICICDTELPLFLVIEGFQNPQITKK